MARKNRVSLSSEVHLLGLAVEAARTLAGRVDESPADEARLFARQASAVLTLVRERLLLVHRIVRGQVDPRLMRCPENDAVDEDEVPGEGDVVLRPWSSGGRPM